MNSFMLLVYRFNENSTELQSGLGHTSSMNSLEQDLTKLLSEKTTQLQKLQEAKDHGTRELSGIEAKLSVAKESLFAKQQQALGMYIHILKIGRERIFMVMIYVLVLSVEEFACSTQIILFMG